MNHFILKKIAGKYLKKNQREKRFVTYDKSCNFLLLFEVKNWECQMIDEIVSMLRKDNKQVTVIGYATGERPLEKGFGETIFFSKKETNFLGKPKTDLIEKIKKQKFDILIDLSDRQLIPLLYLSLYAEAYLKVSSKMFDDVAIFDFILSVDRKKEKNAAQNIEPIECFLFNEIIFYLKSIQTKD